MAIINYLDPNGLQEYDELIKKFISDVAAKSIKAVDIKETTIRFFKAESPDESTAADYEIKLPEQDLSNLLKKLSDGTVGNIISVGEDGTIVDAGIKATELASKDEVSNLETSIKNLLGTIPAESGVSTIVEYIQKAAEDAIKAATYDDTDIKKSISDIQDSIQTIQNTVGDIQDSVTEIQGSLESVQSSVETVQNSVNGIEESVGSIQDSVDTNTQNIADNKKSIGSLESKMNTVTDISSGATFKLGMENGILFLDDGEE